MMKRWKQLVMGKRGRRVERPTRGRLRQQIERLEDRAMLSLTVGPTPHGHDGFGMGPHSLDGSQRYDYAMFSGPQQHDADRQFGQLQSEHFAGMSYGGWHDHGRGFGGASPFDTAFGSFRPQVSQDVGWNQYPTASALSMQQSVLIISTQTSTTIIAGNFGFVLKNTFPTTESNGDGLTSPVGSNSFGNTPPVLTSSAARRQDPNPNPNPNPNSNPGGGGFHDDVAAFNATALSSVLAGIPTAPQLLSRNLDSASLSSNALDAAFQSYASQLLLVTSTSNIKDHDAFRSFDEEMSPTHDEHNDFFQLTDLSGIEDAVLSVKSIEHERQAVDAVLSQLRDFSSLPTEAMKSVAGNKRGNEPSGENDVNAPQVFGLLNTVPIIDPEGGMVMLEATGDANESLFNLAGVEDGHVDLLHVRAGVEAAVGFYQAVDVATEEAPAANLPATSSTSEHSGAAPSSNRFSAESEKDSSGKSAAAVGATALVGAMVWASRKSRREEESELDSATK